MGCIRKAGIVLEMLIVTTNPHFLDWVSKLPYDSKVFKINAQMSRIKKALFYATLNPRLRILSWKYDIVFCDWFNEFASTMSRVSSKRIFVRLHRYEAHNPVHLKTAKLRNIKAVITVSNFYKSIVEEILLDEVPVYVVPNGVDTERFRFSQHINTPLKICTVSNLVPRKRIFDLIVNNPSLEINIGGKGEEKLVLEDAIRRFNLKAKLSGFVKLPEFYHQHDIFIMNSSDESFGVSLVEAMSCGLIPLCFAWHGVEEILPKEYIYHSYEEMQEKLCRIRDMPKTEITRVKRKMRSIVESGFSLETQARNFTSIFNQ
ncbi:MAG: glycosyltransferase family 4 protein [Candidatus Bathyarchaeia archaeon]